MALRRAVRRDRPFELGAKAIREVEFRERVRGYDPAEVDPLLDEVADFVAALQARLAQQESALAAGASADAEDSEHERGVVLVAALLHLRDAHAHATALLGAARRQAREIEHDARVERRRLLRASGTVDAATVDVERPGAAKPIGQR